MHGEALLLVRAAAGDPLSDAGVVDKVEGRLIDVIMPGGDAWRAGDEAILMVKRRGGRFIGAGNFLSASDGIATFRIGGRWTHVEARRTRRYPTKLPARISWGTSGPFPATIKDVSTEGLCVVASTVPTGDHVTIEVRMDLDATVLHGRVVEREVSGQMIVTHLEVDLGDRPALQHVVDFLGAGPPARDR